ncbi:formate dehydrogenase subunit delta [Lichenifustis flavocetrariae]|uniref:Formate dehydrogenase subunit delta n=1 Tax=Lichenifustis flavocetrariae TaxID=2949735 RepID=A0AA41Z6X4_9HYPH|nr:formate dehydrogenase subunit delta [Lichenifustis flavocetrariae]MCW6511618.1 formate dehydrogenase subunit delta [Lichenifustis flavocetrariae]
MDAGAKLDHMANQIATFFRSYPEAEAVAGVHDHIVSFWSPVMRRDLMARAETRVGNLDPLVVAALHTLSTRKSPAQREAAGPSEVGEIGASDAG